MSIYATLWKLKFPKDGDDFTGCEWSRPESYSLWATGEMGRLCKDEKMLR
jgi:hypothetical protein